MIGSLLMVVIGLIIYFDFTQPIYNEAQDIKAKERSQEVFVQNQQSSIKQVQGLFSSFQSQSQLEQVVSLALPADPDVAGAIAQLNGLANNNRLSPESFNVSLVGAKSDSSSVKAKNSSSSAVQVNPLGTVKFSVKMTGTYEDFKNFLKNIETNIRIFDVNTLSVQPAGKSNQDLYNFNIVATAYYQVILPQGSSK